MFYTPIYWPSTVITCTVYYCHVPYTLLWKKTKKTTYLCPSCFTPSAIIEHTNKVIYLRDDDIAAVAQGKLSLHRMSRCAGEDPNRAIQTLQMELQQIMKGEGKVEPRGTALSWVTLCKDDDVTEELIIIIVNTVTNGTVYKGDIYFGLYCTLQ